MIDSRPSSEPRDFRSLWRDIVMMANAARDRGTAAMAEAAGKVSARAPGVSAPMKMDL